MKKTLFTVLLVGSTTCLLQAQTKLYPAIKNYGAVRDVPFAVEKPDTAIDYKIVVEIGDTILNSTELSESLDAVARMYNLHVYGGVPQSNLHVAVVIYANATRIVLNNEEYHKRYGVDNPNIVLIDALKNAGINLYVCGQSIMKARIKPDDVNPDVTVATSRFTAVSTLQMKGYAFFEL